MDKKLYLTILESLEDQLINREINDQQYEDQIENLKAIFNIKK